MGIRSMNYIAMKPGIELTLAVKKYINGEYATIVRDHRGTLVLFESNFTPMWARDALGQYCTYDLEEETAIQQFLGSLNPQDFHMKRAGDEIGMRGKWINHSFLTVPNVVWIEERYNREVAPKGDSNIPKMYQLDPRGANHAARVEVL